MNQAHQAPSGIPIYHGIIRASWPEYYTFNARALVEHWFIIIDDLNFSSNPKSTTFGEKAGMPFVPVGIYDYTDRLVKTVESDYNGLAGVKDVVPGQAIALPPRPHHRIWPRRLPRAVVAPDTTLWREHLHAATAYGRACSARVAIELGYGIVADDGCLVSAPVGQTGFDGCGAVDYVAVGNHKTVAADDKTAARAGSAPVGGHGLRLAAVGWLGFLNAQVYDGGAHTSGYAGHRLRVRVEEIIVLFFSPALMPGGIGRRTFGCKKTKHDKKGVCMEKCRDFGCSLLAEDRGRELCQRGVGDKMADAEAVSKGL